jgi:hypothetical protein
MTQASSQSKHISRLPLKILIIVLVLLGLFLVFVAIRDHHRHTQLEAGIDALGVALLTEGIRTQKTSGCGRPSTEFLQGSKQCSVSLEASVEASTVDAANQTLSIYKSSIDDSEKFNVVDPLPRTIINADKLLFGFGNFTEKQSGQLCTARFDFEQQSAAMRLSFSCDDTSWFTRMFGN